MQCKIILLALIGTIALVAYVVGFILMASASSVGAGTYNGQLSPGLSLSRTGADFSYDYPTLTPITTYNTSFGPYPTVAVYDAGDVKRVPTTNTYHVVTNSSVDAYLVLNEGSIVVEVAADKMDQWSVSMYEEAFLFLPKIPDQKTVICKSYDQNSTTCTIKSKAKTDTSVFLTLGSLMDTVLSFKVTVTTHDYKYSADPIFTCDDKSSCHKTLTLSPTDHVAWTAAGKSMSDTLGNSAQFNFAAETSPYHKYGFPQVS